MSTLRKLTLLITTLFMLVSVNIKAQSDVLIIDYANSFSSDATNNNSGIYNYLLTTQTSVTRVFSVPPSINPVQYQQVWIFGDMGFPNPTTLSPIIAYMNQGGAVYVQSEVGCCNNQAAFIDQLIDSTVTIGNTITHNITKSLYYEFESSPSLLCTPIVKNGAAVRPFNGAPPQNVLFEATPTCGGSITTGDIVGVKFCAGDMISGKGALISNGDFNIFPLSGTCNTVGLLGSPNNPAVIDLISDLLPKLACDSASNGGTLVLTATPQVFCGSTQLGWNYTPGTGGCGIIGCNTDTTFKWTVLNGEPMNVPVNFSCDTCPYPIASPSIPTTYMLTITIGDSNSCNVGTGAQIPITVYPQPLPIAGPITSNSDCNGNIDLSMTGYQGTIQWQLSSGGGPFTTIPGATLDTLSQTGMSSGDCFTVEVSTACGTIFGDTICLGNLTPPSSGNVNYTADCQGDVSLNITGYQGDVQWQVSIGQGPFMDISGAISDTLSQTGINNGDCFRVQLASACDTVFSDTVCVIIPQLPDTGNITYSSGCDGNLDLWLNGHSGNVQWQSSIQAGPWTNISGATLDSLSQSGISTGDCFRAMIYTVCDTVYTDTVCPTMLVGPIANFNMSPPGNSQSNVPISFYDQSIGNIVSWEWIWGDNSPAGNNQIPNPTHTYHNTGIYYVTLIVTDANGCTDTITIPYQVDTLPGNMIIVPNVITPNGDGDNDFLVFKNLEQYGNYLKVYNRWGKVVFEQVNYKNTWDGGESTDGTYYFLLEVIYTAGEEPTLYKGDLSILR